MESDKREIKIVACVRTFNEHDHIEKFINAYQFADVILVADGGSTDDTVAIAESMPKTIVRNYGVKVECKNGIWRNPDGPHLQFLYDWALEEGADWIISQDCDQRPNKYLKERARDIFTNSNKDFIMATQIYLWGQDKYFPDLSRHGTTWQQGLWAWRANINLRVINKMPHFEFSFDGLKSIDLEQSGRDEHILPPCCYMHYGWETMEKTIDHVEYYKNSGLIPGMLFPTKFGGKPETLESWMIE